MGKRSIQSLGGEARAKSLAPGERRKIAAQAAAKRWNIPRATHEGPLTINNFEINSYVLEKGERVLSRIGFIRALGRTGKAKGGRSYDREFKVPVFLSANNLKPFINNELLENSNPILFIDTTGNKAIGYKAELLPTVCNVFLEANDARVLNANQSHIAERCKLLIRGLATVGIIALVDEATGYQEIRDRKALEKILEKYLLTEDAKWAKRFPDEFYQQMFRLKNWQWENLNVKRPSVVGKYTNDVIYERLAPGVLKKLRELNPRDEKGRRRARHHQWLTEDVGHPELQRHLYMVIALMRAASVWDVFYRNLQRALPKCGETIPLALDE
jgi:hypothetical protein